MNKVFLLGLFIISFAVKNLCRTRFRTFAVDFSKLKGKEKSSPKIFPFIKDFRRIFAKTKQVFCGVKIGGMSFGDLGIFATDFCEDILREVIKDERSTIFC